MAAKTFYVLGTAAPSPNFFGQLQDGGSAPTAANSTFGWAPGKNAVTSPFYAARLGASSTQATQSATSTIDSKTIPTKGTGATNTTAGDSFVTPVAYRGSFAATAWTFNWNMRAGVAGAVGRIRVQVFASVNADGTSARELTTSTLVGSIVTLSTSADTNSSISWSPGAITLNNEYLFFQLEWEETTAGSSNTDTVLFRIGTSTIVTPVFSFSVLISIASSQKVTVGKPRNLLVNIVQSDFKLAFSGGDSISYDWVNSTGKNILAQVNNGYGFYYSSDYGNSWNLLLSTPAETNLWAGCAASDNLTYIYAGTYARLKVSSNSGSSFSNVSPYNGQWAKPVCSYDGSKALCSELATGGSEVLYFSSNYGLAWNLLDGWRLDDAATSSYTISGGTNYLSGSISGNSGSFVSVRSINGHSSISTDTKVCFEFKCTAAASNQNNYFGLASSGFNIGTYVGNSNYSIGYNTSGNVSAAGGITNVVSPGWNFTPVLNDVIQFAVDFAAGKGWVGKNGIWTSGDPAAGTSPNFTFTPGTVGVLFPALTLLSGAGSWQAALSYPIMTYAPPSGFVRWGSVGLGTSGYCMSSDGSIIYVSNTSAANLWKSTDSGTSWVAIGLPLNQQPAPQATNRLACSSTGQNLVMSAMYYADTTSSDYGVTWTTHLVLDWDSTATGGPANAKISLNGKILYYHPNSSSPGVYVSYDMGVTKKRLTLPNNVIPAFGEGLYLSGDGNYTVIGVGMDVNAGQLWIGLSTFSLLKGYSIVKTYSVSEVLSTIRFKPNNKLVTISQNQVVTVLKLVSRLTLIVSQTIVTLDQAISKKLALISSPETLTTFRQKAYVKTIATILSHQAVTNLWTANRSFLALSPQSISSNKAISKLISASSLQVISYFKQTGKSVLLYSFESLLASRSILKKVSISSPQIFNYTSRKIVSASANFDGASTVAFAGKEIASSVFNADGVSSVSFFGTQIQVRSGAAQCDGAATVAFTGLGGVSAKANADGTSTASFTGKEISSAKVNSDGTSAVSFTGLGTVSGNVNADGVSSVSFTGKEIASARVNSDGVSSVSFTGKEIASANVNADGISSVSFTGFETASSRLNSDGVSSASFTISSRAVGSAASDGIATVSFAGKEIASTRVNADGLTDVAFAGTTAFIGTGIVPAAGHADGVATVSFAGKEIASAKVNADGIADVSFFGNGIVSAKVNADGIVSVSFVGHEIASAKVNADGVANINFVGDSSFGSIGTVSGSVQADGSSSVVFIGKELASAKVNADGIASVSFTGKEIAFTKVNSDGVASVSFAGSTSFQGIGTVSGAVQADGSASIAFVGKEIASAVVNSDGLASVSFIGHEIASARVNADGVAGAAFTGSLLLKAAASFDGVSSVDFRGAYLQSGAVRADGIANVLFTGSLATIGYGQMDGQATVLFYGAEEFIFDPNILRAGYVSKIYDYMPITDWKAIADGVDRDIGITLNISRGNVLLSYTPSLYDDPDLFTQNVYLSGDIFTTTENKVIWIKPADPDYPISAKGEILYLSA